MDDRGVSKSDHVVSKSIRVKRRTFKFRKKKRQRLALQHLKEHVATTPPTLGPVPFSMTDVKQLIRKQTERLQDIQAEKHLYCLACNSLLLKRPLFDDTPDAIVVKPQVHVADYETIRVKNGLVSCLQGHVVGKVSTNPLNKTEWTITINPNKTNYYR